MFVNVVVGVNTNTMTNLFTTTISSSSSSKSSSSSFITTALPRCRRRNHQHHIRTCNSSYSYICSSSSVSPSLVIDEAQSQTVSSQTSPIASPYRRRLILLRHAQSSWTNSSLRDHDRPLSETGEADAIKVSQKLHQLGWVPELILCSDALRTKETLKCMQDKVQEFSEAAVHFISSFYSIAAMDGQTAEHLQEAICKYAQDETFTVMCMGHNRGWEEAASMLSGASVELKTCNAALLEASGKSWEEAFSLAGFGGWKLHHIIKPH